MSMRIGRAYVQYRKKLNTKSSTEAELVGVDYVLTQVIWTQYFLKDQVYKIDENVVYQDIQSAINWKRMLDDK